MDGIDRATSGFTLVELLVVLTVFAALVGIFAPRIDRERFRLDGAVQTLALELTASQRKAVLQQHDIAIRFDVPASTFIVHVDENSNGKIDPGEATKTVDFEDGVVYGLAGAPPLGTASVAVTFADGEGNVPVVTFHRNGAASEFGAVYLTSAAGASEYTRSVQVVRATGEVTCHSYREGSWDLTC
jgi:prepilin-type N-terminal cleavage/methylation domain-containing protein